MMKKKIKICFLADKHGLFDDRIYWKMAVSLKKRGFEVHYLLIGNKNEKGVTKEGINYEILKIKTFSNNRYLNFVLKRLNPKNNYKLLFKKAAVLKADIYHFHDLNINKIGLKIKKLPHKPIVIYDVHDPFAVNIKDYVANQSNLKWFANLYANYINRFEKNNAKNYDFIITTEVHLKKDFQKYLPSKKVDIIYNYTYLHNFRKDTEIKYDLIYCGGITEFRGAIKIIEAIRILKIDFEKIRMIFLGTIFSNKLKEDMLKLIKKYNLQENIELKNNIPYHDVASYYNQSKIGLGIFLPIETHKIILPIKLFEYMAFGLPIVASNFGHINNYILKDNVGLTIDATSPKEIAKAVKILLQNKKLYNTFKNNGIDAVEKKYSWSLMEKKLFLIYDELLESRKRVN